MTVPDAAPAHPAGPLQTWIAYNDAANDGDHERAAQYLSPTLGVLVNGAATISSAEEDRAVQTELIRCYPDYTRDYVAGFEHGEWATVEWRMRGRAAAGTGLPDLDVPGCSLVRIRDAVIVEARLYHPTGALDRVAERALGSR